MPRVGNKLEYRDTNLKESCSLSGVSATTSNKEECVQDINILLLGETGVGKSTFINAFINYLTFESLSDAEANDLLWLIPAKFSIADDDYKDSCTVQIGDSKNESREVGASATQLCKSYVFQVDDMRVRLIDTPGIGDTRGIDQDNANFENILSYLGEYEELHAICVLLKPNNARLNVMFQYCIKQLFSRLQKSASKNIIFLFTNSRSTFYRPGDTFLPLKKILTDIHEQPPFVEIPCYKGNIFCIDNEAFRFLAALKYNLEFSREEKVDFERSWTKSAEECWRMLRYIAGDCYNGLIPHRIKDTISINEARRVVIRLSQPLAEVAQLIQNNIIVLERHRLYLQLNENNQKELRGKLYIPVINVRVSQMDQPRTTCKAPSCCEVYEVGGIKLNHFRQLCHNPCYLRNVPAEIIGSPELIYCTAMGGRQTCSHCGCSYLTHMHIYYITETYEDKIEDVNVDSELSKNITEAAEVQKKVTQIVGRSQEYKDEEATIIKTIAKFAHFLQTNAITPYNDSYKQYMEYLIDSERSLGDNSNKQTIKYYEQMLARYHEEKKVLEEAFKIAQTSNFENVHMVTADEVLQNVQELYRLKHTGAKIKELYDKQEGARSHERVSEEEYVHPRRKGRGKWMRIFGFYKN